MDTKSSNDPETEEPESESVSNIHRELAIKAAELFDKGEFTASLTHLTQLQEQRPLDTRFTHNAAVVMFYMNGFKNAEDFKKKLNSVCSRVSQVYYFRCMTYYSCKIQFYWHDLLYFLGRNQFR